MKRREMQANRWIQYLVHLLMIMSVLIFAGKGLDVYAADEDFIITDGVVTGYTGTDTEITIP